MKSIFRMLALLAAVVAGQAMAQQSLDGVWQGKLQVDKSTSMLVQFTFAKKPDGSYSATLDSPDNPAIRNVTAGQVTWAANALKVEVPTLNGSYAGTLKEGKFDGKWSQQGGDLALVLNRYEPPKLSKVDIDALSGTWSGPLKLPSGKLTFVFRFKPDDKGGVQGTLSVPEQGGQEIPMSDIALVDGKFTFRIPVVNGLYKGTLANDGINGRWTQGGQPMEQGLEVNLKKGEVATQVYALKLSTQAFAELNGKWSGTVKGPAGSATVVLRFESNGNGEYVGFADVPERNARNLPVTEASLDGGKLALKLMGGQVQYDAAVNGRTMMGQWSQGPMAPVEVTFTKQ